MKTKVAEQIKNIAGNYNIDKIVLFGSRARGTNKLLSDIDLAVFPSTGKIEKGHFTSDIDDLDTLLKVDVVFMDESTDKTLKDNIAKEGVIIYERTNKKN